MNIIISGMNGQLGSSFYKYRRLYNNLNLFFFNHIDLNITRKFSIEKLIKKIKPNYFINCAAYTDVNKSEFNKEVAFSINCHSLKLISNICKKNKCTLVHFSSDYVFDGQNKFPYSEIDKTNPLSIYGKSKLCGEKEILESGVNFVILRVSWLYNPLFKTNLVSKLVNQIKKNKDIYAVIDEKSIPTCSYNLAENILFLINQNKFNNLKKIYHYVNSGKSVSVYNLAKFLKKSLNTKKYNSVILPVKSNKFNNSLIRPKYSALDNKLFLNKFNIKEENWRKVLINNIKEYYI